MDVDCWPQIAFLVVLFCFISVSVCCLDLSVFVFKLVLRANS